jgi:UDP-N-acetylmuramate: L-alanyl-gamma-D-glutamyl-meso-diaminopimelate ligase
MARHLHILGICGTFMGGLAALAQASGWRVTGCDSAVYPPMSEQLARLGIELIEGYDEAQLGLRPECWVIGNVVTRGNPLMEAILERGERFVSGPQWLAESVLRGRRVAAIAGTHGKTSVSAMLAWILEEAGRAPGFLIGGAPRDFPFSARLGAGEWFVIEADEYDTAFFDKRSKFVHYRPEVAVLNNLEFDHGDIFVDLADIERQFHHFVRIVPRNGLVVSNGRDANLERVLTKGCWTPIERIGVDAGWQVGEQGAESDCEIRWRGEVAGRLAWSQLGEHNRMNALAALAAARRAGVAPGRALEALRGFGGVRRRLELRGTVRGVTVYDDFAHHPTAIRATLEALRARAGEGRLLAVLEPRSNTMKLGLQNEALAPALTAADRAWVYSAGLAWDARAVLAPLGERARCLGELDALVEEVAREARAGDRILVMSNGAFGGVHEKLLVALERRAAA